MPLRRATAAIHFQQSYSDNSSHIYHIEASTADAVFTLLYENKEFVAVIDATVKLQGLPRFKTRSTISHPEATQTN